LLKLSLVVGWYPFFETQCILLNNDTGLLYTLQTTWCHDREYCSWPSAENIFVQAALTALTLRPEASEFLFQYVQLCNLFLKQLRLLWFAMLTNHIACKSTTDLSHLIRTTEWEDISQKDVMLQKTHQQITLYYSNKKLQICLATTSNLTDLLQATLEEKSKFIVISESFYLR